MSPCSRAGSVLYHHHRIIRGRRRRQRRLDISRGVSHPFCLQRLIHVSSPFPSAPLTPDATTLRIFASAAVPFGTTQQLGTILDQLTEEGVLNQYQPEDLEMLAADMDTDGT